LRPRLPVDKGVATEEIVRRVGARAVICVGDDTTDIDMFRAVARLRDAGLEGANVAVRSEEASPEVAANADYAVDGIEGVERLLEELLRALRRTGP
jgi:trehalose 6-phosphate phosphatase